MLREWLLYILCILFCCFLLLFLIFSFLLLNNSKDIIELNVMTKSVTSSSSSLSFSVFLFIHWQCLIYRMYACSRRKWKYAYTIFVYKPRQRKCLVNNFFSLWRPAQWMMLYTVQRKRKNGGTGSKRMITNEWTRTNENLYEWKSFMARTFFIWLIIIIIRVMECKRKR